MEPDKNLAIVKQMFTYHHQGNIPAFLSLFSPEAVWVEPGDEKEIPYAGTFTGIEGISKLLTILSQSLKVKAFIPNLFLTGGDNVAVFGDNDAEVVSTGKSYFTKWVYLFTLQNGKITHLGVYMDTMIIAKAFSHKV